MYNPIKRFYAQAAGGKSQEKETAKKEKKQPDLLHQIEKQVKEIKAQQPVPEPEVLASINKDKKSKFGQTATSAISGDLNSTSNTQKTGNRNKPSIRMRQPKLAVNVYYTKYAIVRKVLKHDFKMRIDENDIDDADLVWCDHCLPPERIMRMRPFQRTNHYPGMQALTRKNSLGKNLNGLRALFPDAFDFYP